MTHAVAPDGTVLLLLFTVGLAPLAVAAGVRSRLPAENVMMALYGAELGLLPAALARPNGIHEFFFSLARLLLALCWPCGRQHWRRWLVPAALAVFVALCTEGSLRLYWPALRQVVRLNRMPTPRPPVCDPAALLEAVGREPVTLLEAEPWAAEEALSRAGLLAPSFYKGMSSVWWQPAEERKLAELRKSQYAVLGEDGMVREIDLQSGPARLFLRLGVPYRERHPPFIPGKLIDRELHRNWSVVEPLGDGYVLMRRVR